MLVERHEGKDRRKKILARCRGAGMAYQTSRVTRCRKRGVLTGGRINHRTNLRFIYPELKIGSMTPPIYPCTHTPERPVVCDPGGLRYISQAPPANAQRPDPTPRPSTHSKPLPTLPGCPLPPPLHCRTQPQELARGLVWRLAALASQDSASLPSTSTPRTLGAQHMPPIHAPWTGNSSRHLVGI